MRRHRGVFYDELAGEDIRQVMPARFYGYGGAAQHVLKARDGRREVRLALHVAYEYARCARLGGKARRRNAAAVQPQAQDDHPFAAQYRHIYTSIMDYMLPATRTTTGSCTFGSASASASIFAALHIIPMIIAAGLVLAFACVASPRAFSQNMKAGNERVISIGSQKSTLVAQSSPQNQANQTNKTPAAQNTAQAKGSPNDIKTPSPPRAGRAAPGYSLTVGGSAVALAGVGLEIATIISIFVINSESRTKYSTAQGVFPFLHGASAALITTGVSGVLAAISYQEDSLEGLRRWRNNQLILGSVFTAAGIAATAGGSVLYVQYKDQRDIGAGLIGAGAPLVLSGIINIMLGIFIRPRL